LAESWGCPFAYILVSMASLHSATAEQSLTHVTKQAFVAAWLTELLRRDDMTLARTNLLKFLIRDRLEARIRDLRKQAVGKAFQHTRFGDDAASRAAVSDQYAFEFHARALRPAATTTVASATSISGSTTTGAWAISTAKRSSSVPAGWIFRRSRVVFNFGYATWCGAKGVRSSCKRRTGVFTRTFCASFPVKMTSPDRFSPLNTRVPTAGYWPRMTD
jgi:hypothetical protein